MSNSQIERISRMEEYLDRSRDVIDRLTAAIEEYESVQKDYYELQDYYTSVQWMNDHEDDESGRLPEDLKRGVLSEDAVYDLIADHAELMIRLQRAVLTSMEEDH